MSYKLAVHNLYIIMWVLWQKIQMIYTFYIICFFLLLKGLDHLYLDSGQEYINFLFKKLPNLQNEVFIKNIFMTK